jgi:type IV pilus assembly protein PilP
MREGVMQIKRFGVVLLVAVFALTLAAQQPATPTVPPTQTAPAAEVEEDAELGQSLEGIWEDSAAEDDFRYDPQGRRDPFRSLIGPSPKIESSDRPPGTPGFLIDEMDLQGIVRTGNDWVAMVNGPDNNGYLLRSGDKVFDGEVIRVNRDSIVFRQVVNDPLSVARYREVVKDLTPQSEKRTP